MSNWVENGVSKWDWKYWMKKSFEGKTEEVSFKYVEAPVRQSYLARVEWWARNECEAQVREMWACHIDELKIKYKLVHTRKECKIRKKNCVRVA